MIEDEVFISKRTFLSAKKRAINAMMRSLRHADYGDVVVYFKNPEYLLDNVRMWDVEDTGEDLQGLLHKVDLWPFKTLFGVTIKYDESIGPDAVFRHKDDVTVEYARIKMVNIN